MIVPFEELLVSVPVMIGYEPPPGTMILMGFQDERYHGLAVYERPALALPGIPALADGLAGARSSQVLVVQRDEDDLAGLPLAMAAQALLAGLDVPPFHPAVLSVRRDWSAATGHSLAGGEDEVYDLAVHRAGTGYLRCVHQLGLPHPSLAALYAAYEPSPGPLRDEIAAALAAPHTWGPAAPRERGLLRRAATEARWIRQDSAARAWRRLSDPLPLTGAEAAPILLSLADPEVAGSFQGWLAAALPGVRPATPDPGGSPVLDHLRALVLMAPPALLPGPCAVLAAGEAARGGGKHRILAARNAGRPDRNEQPPGPQDLAAAAASAGVFSGRPVQPPAGPFPDDLLGRPCPPDLYWACIPPGAVPPDPWDDPLLPGPGPSR